VFAMSMSSEIPGRAPRRINGERQLKFNRTLHLYHLLHTSSVRRSRGSKSGGADDGRIRLRFMRCRNCTLFLAKFMASASYKYLVSLVSACLLGTQDEAPLIIVAGQFIVHLSAIAISLMPLPGQGPTILSPNPGGR